MEIFRNVCPRNCYGTCSILSYVENGRLMKVTGDPKHGFTQGHLCAKGYAYTQYVYNPLRIKYPILQTPRGSGNWQRISWDKAYTIIARKILELNDRYGSNLASGYAKYSGNLGVLHQAVEGLFNSIGPHTKPFGDICSATGNGAVMRTVGDQVNPYPEDMAHSKLIVIWGANPAITNIHQMKFIYKAKKHGAKLIVIDPIFTETAAKADLYVQINPGTDVWLALGISKVIIEKDAFDHDYVKNQSIGWEEYKELIQNNVNYAEITEKTGVRMEVIKKLADLYANVKPTSTWNGFGIQRTNLGGVSIQVINSLSAMTGNIHIPNGGVYYMHVDTYDLPHTLFNFPEKKHPFIQKSREINIGNFAIEAKNLKDPPLKFLWIASHNPLAQDHDLYMWEELLKELELVVTVDLYMTSTAKHSDIVLPAASLFEEEDLHVSYWHHWIALNQKAIDPYYEAKSDLKIAGELAKKLNELSPGFSTFPSELKPIDWIQKEITKQVQELYGLASWRDLLDGPKMRKIVGSNSFSKEQYIFFPLEWPRMKEQPVNSYPFRLLSPQSLLRIHSQFSSITWLNPAPQEIVVEINDKVANQKGIKEDHKVKVFNQFGSVNAIVSINRYLPDHVVVIRQSEKNPVNRLIGFKTLKKNDMSSTEYYDTFVDLTKSEE